MHLTLNTGWAERPSQSVPKPLWMRRACNTRMGSFDGSGWEALVCRLDGVLPTRWKHLLYFFFICGRSTVFEWTQGIWWQQRMHSWLINPNKKLFIFVIFFQWRLFVYLVSRIEEDSDDAELKFGDKGIPESLWRACLHHFLLCSNTALKLCTWNS